MAIDVIGGLGYLAFLELIHESDDCCTHAAEIFGSELGNITGYVKFYRDARGTSRGLVNEACGFLLARALGLPVPKRGFILLMSGERLIAAHPTLARELDPKANYPTWVTEWIRGAAGLASTHEAAEAIRKWQKLPDLIAFDHWVFNADRSMRNLLRSKRGGIWLIDHGHLGGSVYWDRHLLDPTAQYVHPILDLLWEKNPPLTMATRIVDAATTHLGVFEHAHAELRSLLDLLLEYEEDRIAFEEFLRQRAVEGHQRIKHALGVLV